MMYEKDVLRLRPLNYSSVRLAKSGYEKQFTEMLDYFLNIPNDDMLVGFRKRAGLEHPGNELGGWYSNDGSGNPFDWDEIFNAFGQWFSLFGRAYSITQDQRIYDKAVSLLSEWGKTIDSTGYFFYSNACNAYHYSYEKIMGGLVDLYMYAGIKEAKEYLDKITDWAETNLPRKRNPAYGTRETFVGGDPEIRGIDNEWYTLSENLYRMYTVSGDEKYRNFAMVWHYDYYWDGLRNKNENVMTRVHGYSHVNNLGGAAYAYRVWGDKKYLETIENAYEILHKNQLMASGGYAFSEHMADTKGSNYGDVEKIARAFEVPCGSWAAFKLVRHLISLTGKARYGDWAESILYNAIGPALPMKDDSQRRGKTFYYADYRIGGGRKVYYEHSYPCCSGTYPQAVTEYHNIIFFKKDDGIYISQYIPSVLDTEINGGRLQVEIEGHYPLEDHFNILITGKGEFNLALRIPSWVRGEEAAIYVNGEKYDTAIIPGEWALINKNWTGSEKITVVFPMHLWSYPISFDHPERAALMFGPMMLAAKGKQRKINASIANLDKTVVHQDGLKFTAADPNQQVVEFIPYLAVQEKEWYTVYCDFEQ